MLVSEFFKQISKINYCNGSIKEQEKFINQDSFEDSLVKLQEELKAHNITDLKKITQQDVSNILKLLQDNIDIYCPIAIYEDSIEVLIPNRIKFINSNKDLIGTLYIFSNNTVCKENLWSITENNKNYLKRIKE